MDGRMYQLSTWQLNRTFPPSSTPLCFHHFSPFIVKDLIPNAKLKSKSKDDDKIMAKVMKKFTLNVLIAEAYRHNWCFNVREKSGVIIIICF